MFSSNIDATTILDKFNRLMDGISCFTDDSLNSIGPNASATLRELSFRAQILDKDLDKARVLARMSNFIFSTFVIGVAAVVSPLGVIAVGPWLQTIDPLLNYAMENPIKEKQKLVETMLFITHSAIVKVGEIKDLVRTLGILVAELKDAGDVVIRRFSEVEKAVEDVLKEVKLAALEYA